MALLFLMGCQNEEERFVVQQQGNRTITAVIDNGLGLDGVSTRTEVDADGHVTWTEKDTLGVFSNVSQNVPFASTGSGGNVDFTGTLTDEDKDIKCVYFPYNKNVKLEGNKLTLKLPRIYNYTDENLTPMLGEEQEDETFKFKHLCGVMRVIIKNAPKGVSNLDILGYNLHGTAYVADVTTPNATLVRSGNVETSIRIKFNLKEISDVTLYIPLIPDTYNRIELEYKDSKNKKIFKNKSVKTPVTITPGMLLDMPVLTALDDDAVVENYLDKIDAYIQTIAEESYSSIKEKLVQWLNEQDYVEKLELVEGNNHDEYEVVFRNGYETSIGFIIQEPSIDARSNVDFALKLFYIPEVENEIIKTNIKVKSYSFLELSEGDEQYEKSQEQVKQAFEYSPIKSFGNFYCLSNKKNVIQEFISDKKEEYGAILFTDTHGIGGGAFRVLEEENASYFGINDESKYHKIAPLYVKIPYIGTYLLPYKKIDCIAIKPAYLVEGDLINDDAILFGAYCWSANKYGNYSLFEHLKGNFLGYTKTIGAKLLVPEVVYYFSQLFNGVTSLDAYAYAERVGQLKNLRHNNSNKGQQRYFSISTDDINENNTLTGSINGYKNLKESIKYYVYYKEGTDIFFPNDESIQKNKIPITPVLDNSDKIKLKGDVTYTFTDLEPGKTYTYAIGFEYNDKYYYGDLKQFVFTEPVETSEECDIELLNATCSGYVYAEKDSIAEYGICYSATNQEPTINDKKEVASNWDENDKKFSTTLTNLDAKTKYYYCAYAKFKGQDEPKYGEVKTFETEEVDVINTAAASDITHLSATASGYVFAEETALAEYGICYSESETPSVVIGEKLNATELDEQGKFSVALDCLEPGTTYYYCAYAVINGETVYGEIKSFKTQEAPLTPGTAIDLGLPSGTKWASHNLGASSPEGYGGLYGWGDPTGKHTEPVVNSSGEYIDRNLEYYGGYDPPFTISGGKLDIAKAKWGGRWRLPTKEEILELINYCTHKYEVVGTVPGVKVVGKNGNSIFLPAAGIRTYKGGDRKHDGETGSYWGGTRSTSDDRGAWRCADYFYLNIYDDGGLRRFSSSTALRGAGFSVRPVR